MKRLLAILLLTLSLGAFSTAHAGVPVVDGTHVGTTLMNWLKRFQDFQKELEQYKQVNEDFQKSYSAISQNRLGELGIGDLVEVPEFVKKSELMGRQLDDSWKTLSGDAEKIKKSLVTYDRCSPLEGESRDLCTREINTLAMNMSDMNAVMTQIEKRTETIKKLGNSASATSDVKAAADLIARIGKEQAELQNTSQQLQVQMQMAQLQQQAIWEEKNQIYQKQFSSNKAATPPPIKWKKN